MILTLGVKILEVHNSAYFTMFVDCVIFDANSFSFIGDIIVEPCIKIPAVYTLFYNNTSLDDIWFLTDYDKSKLYWLKEFGCSVPEDGVSSDEYVSSLRTIKRKYIPV